jgi:SAM-dependent methyltransferase
VSFVSRKWGQFRYFDQQLRQPQWKGKRVLDFGGNCGNILADPESTIDRHKYWCIDVSRDGIEQGRRSYPDAHWIFYNRYNFEFNPGGVKGLAVPDTGVRFDFILAYSVFTHTSREEMIELVGQLTRFLAGDGVLAFTFFDPDWIAFDGDPYPGSNLKWRLEVRKRNSPALDVDSLEQKGRGAKWLTLVNDDELYREGEHEEEQVGQDKRAYIVFCDPALMKSLFPSAEILPPVRPERHHCCVIRAN